MTDYIPPDPAVGEWVYRQRRSEKALYDRMRAVSPEQLKHLARDENEPCEVRSSALSMLVQSSHEYWAVPEDSELVDILLGLLNESDPELRRQSLSLARHFWPNARVVEKVRTLLRDPNIQIQAAAAMVLAMKRDEAVMPYLLAWFHGDDQPHRNVAMQGLSWVNTPESHRVLQESYEQGGRGEEDRIGYANTLILHVIRRTGIGRVTGIH